MCSCSPLCSFGGTWTSRRWSGVSASNGLIGSHLVRGRTCPLALWERRGYSARHRSMRSLPSKRSPASFHRHHGPIHLFQPFGVLFPVFHAQLEGLNLSNNHAGRHLRVLPSLWLFCKYYITLSVVQYYICGHLHSFAIYGKYIHVAIY